MNAERWARLQQLFERALDLPHEARGAFVDATCGDDRELHDEAVSLLAAHTRLPDTCTLPAGWLGTLVVPEQPRFAPGDTVASRYVVRGLLGRGGMGEVYDAWDGELSIPVALKTLRLAAGGEEALRSLKLEGLLARSVWHPNVCRVFALGRHAEGTAAVWFLTMELLRGTTLAARLREGRLTPDRIRRLAEQMAAGLGAAHAAGVVHRDFKPGNVVLVSRDGGEQAVVTDFGIARAVAAVPGSPGQGASPGPIVGSPAYMAPEQVRGEEAGPAADVYALGIVLHEMITGAPPFTGGSATEVAQRRLVEDAPAPGSLVPGLDERWDAVVRRCLERDPERRFRRAEDVAEALAGRFPAGHVESPDLAIRARHTLPAERDAFMGRVVELDELARVFAGDTRLVTLVGAGGMGKTRLAIRHGWRTLDAWPGGTWFCDLTEAGDQNGIASRMAASLGIHLGRGDPVAHLGRAIAGRGRCLLLLDNLEQVVELAREALARWMEQAGEARFLVTSRQRLDLPGERVQAVESLGLDEGVALFESRARGLHPGLRLDGAELESAREIVRLVDCMPLAIELASARMRVMSAAAILARLRRRFQLLAGGRGARHETLEATIDGSWELLHPWEQAAYAQCAVFEGGFTLDAAGAVFDLEPWPEAPWPVDILQSLVDKSLLRAGVPTSGSGAWLPNARFGMYVSLQEYARIKLRADPRRDPGDDAPTAERAAEDRHAQWYARHGTEAAIEALDRPGGVELRWRLEHELPNLVTACRRSLGRGEGAAAVRLYRGAWALLSLRGPSAAAVDLGLELLRDEGLGRDDRADALTMLATAEHVAGSPEAAAAHFQSALALCHAAGRRSLECTVRDNLSKVLRLQGRIPEARRFAEEALEIARDIGARRAEGAALGSLGVLHRHEGRMDEAGACFEAALAIHRELGNRRLEGVMRNNLGILDYDHGRLEEARVHLEAALAVHREVGNRNSEGVVRGNLGNLHQDAGRVDAARSEYEAALAIHREVGHRRFEAIVLGDLGNLHRAMGRPEAARPHLERALALCREGELRSSEGIALGDLGALHRALGDGAEARACYEAALDIHREVGNRRFEGIVLGRLAELLRVEGRLAEAWAGLEAGEAILDPLDRLEFARLLCLRGELELDRGDTDAARAAHRDAESIARHSGSGGESELGQLLGNLRDRIGVSPPAPPR